MHDPTEALIDKFALRPHPFDGWFAPVETGNDRPARFHYMIRAGEYAAWHRCAGRLIMTHIDGAPLTVTMSDGGRAVRNAMLPAVDRSCMIEEGEWRTWESLGEWSLMMVSVENADCFMQWTLAPDHWHPTP